MCLKTCSLSLEYDNKAHMYVGYGYKAIWNAKLDKKWKEANGNEKSLNLSHENANDHTTYIPGFHIFLCEEDARNYSAHYNSGDIVKVKFREVLAFGTNSSGVDYKNCVVTRYMKVVEILERV